MIKQEEREFVIKPYPKEKLATMYHPQLCPKAAVGKMRRWINLNPELKRKMEEARVCAQTHWYTSRQVAILVDFLGEP